MSERLIDKVREQQKLGHSLRMQRFELAIEEELLKAAKDGCNQAEIPVKDPDIADMRSVIKEYRK